MPAQMASSLGQCLYRTLPRDRTEGAHNDL